MSPKQKTPWSTLALACAAAVLLILLLNILPLNAKLARFLVDKHEAHGANMLAWQNAMWIAFFCGLALLYHIYRNINAQESELSQHYLPEDDSRVLLKADMAQVNKQVYACGGTGMLADMVLLVARQFQSTGSVSMCNDILNTTVELKQHEIDLHYNSVRYITWLLPTLGFCGTVHGILLALDTASAMKLDDPKMLPTVISELSVAFWTTLLALLMSCVMMWVTHLVQTSEERLLNSSARYCVKNLINRLLER